MPLPLFWRPHSVHHSIRELNIATITIIGSKFFPFDLLFLPTALLIRVGAPERPFLAVDRPRRLYFIGSVFIIVRKKSFIVTNLARTNSCASLIESNI